MNIHRALLHADEFAALARSIPDLELPGTFAVRRTGGVRPGCADGVPRAGLDSARPPGPDGARPEPATEDGDVLLPRLAPESLDSLRFLMMSHQFSSVGVSVRAQTASTLLIGEYSVSYGLATGLTRIQLVRFPQSPGVQLCAMPVARLSTEIVDGAWQLQAHDHADVGLTIIPRSKGRDKKWLAAHSVCCLFSWRHRHADRPDIKGMIDDLCAEDRTGDRASDDGGGQASDRGGGGRASGRGGRRAASRAGGRAGNAAARVNVRARR